MEADNPLNNPSSGPTASPEAPLPDPSALGLKPTPRKKGPNLGVIIGVVAALLLVLVIAGVVLFASNTSSNKKASQQQYDAGFEKGKAEAQTQYLAQEASDTRTYKSAPEFGSFELPIPKNWSLQVAPLPADGTFIALADPSYVDIKTTAHVFSFDLKRGDYDKIVLDYNNQAKKVGGDIKSGDVTVSGIKGRRYSGTFDTKNKIKSDLVVLPYREKVLVIKTDDPSKYGASFNTILDNLKLYQ